MAFVLSLFYHKVDVAEPPADLCEDHVEASVKCRDPDVQLQCDTLRCQFAIPVLEADKLVVQRRKGLEDRVDSCNRELELEDVDIRRDLDRRVLGRSLLRVEAAGLRSVLRNGARDQVGLECLQLSLVLMEVPELVLDELPDVRLDGVVILRRYASPPVPAIQSSSQEFRFFHLGRNHEAYSSCRFHFYRSTRL